MTQVLHLRAVSPDGRTWASGPVRADVVADAVKAAGVPWQVLEARGWRVVPCGAGEGAA